MKDVKLHRVAGRKTADGAGEFAGILDGRAIHRGDDVTRFDAGFGGRTVGLGFGDQCAFRLLEAEAVGDVGCHRLNLDTDPATADRSLVLELGNHRSYGRCRDGERDADAAA